MREELRIRAFENKVLRLFVANIEGITGERKKFQNAELHVCILKLT